MSREAINIGEVKLEYFQSMEMMEDYLRKPLGPQKFKTVRELISKTVSFNETMC